MPTLQQTADYLKKHDPHLAPIITASPLPNMAAHNNYYQALVESIIGQQLSIKAADAILKRFINLFGQFPSPHELTQKDIEELRAVGISRPKARYIQDLARNVIDGKIDFSTFDSLTNDQIMAELLPVKGIGEWTVHMFLMFCMGRFNVLPVGDLGIRNGIQKLYNLNRSPTPADIEAIAVQYNWHPFESVACWYVWSSLDNAPAIN